MTRPTYRRLNTLAATALLDNAGRPS